MFNHLHVHTHYSISDGHCRIKELVEKAVANGYTALAITDHGYMYGAMEFYNTCKAAGIKPIIGVELYTAPESIYEKTRETRESGHIVLLAKNKTGYQNLCQLCSVAATDGMYYKPRIDLDLLRKHHEGLICLSACVQGDIPRLIANRKWVEAKELAATYKEIFGEDFYLELQYHGLAEQAFVLPRLVLLGQELDIPVVATNDVHYVNREDAFAQRVLQCIGNNTTVDNPESVGYGHPDEWYLKTEEEMRSIELIRDLAPESIDNTQAVADKCNLELQADGYYLPDFPTPDGWESNAEYLKALCSAGLKKRYGSAAKEMAGRLQHELQVIADMGFIDYFLIVFDIVSFAKMNGIPVGPGRGSAAGSIVAYCLGITDLDPMKYGLMFERFLNPERITMPDIDIDIDPNGRGMVIDHIIEKYGDDHVSQIITFSTRGAKYAVQDAAKALNLDAELVKKVKSMLPSEKGITLRAALQANRTLQKAYEGDRDVKRLLDVSMRIEGLIRQTSTHAAGIVITPKPLTELIPVTRGKDGTTILVSQYDMASVESAGLLKVDLLSLTTLTVLANAEQAIREKQAEGARPFSLSALKMQDPAVYAMLAQGNTSGVFQLESDGMRDMLRSFKPTCFEDLIAAIAMYRPGPMESIPTFVKNKHHPEQVTYLHPLLKPILGETYSAILYQEQVMAIVQQLAGYSLGRADLVRRAMAKKKPEKMAQEKNTFIHGEIAQDGTVVIDGCLRRGLSLETAEALWAHMVTFAAYAFNKSHSATYAVLSYRTAFLKCHFPLEYMAALLTEALGDNKELAKLLNDCEKQGIKILPPDINRSQAKFTVEGDGIRFGLMAIKDTGKAILAELTMERTHGGDFKDLHDLIERTISSANTQTIEALIKSGALDAFDRTRAEMLAVLPKAINAASKARKKYNAAQISMEESFFGGNEDQESFRFPEIEYPTDVQPLTTKEMLEMEQEVCGIYISGHPMSEYKDIVGKKATHQLCELSEDKHIADQVQVRIAGVIKSIRKVTTKTKKQMAFLTLEDQTGCVDITVFPRAYEAYNSKLNEGVAILVYGKTERSEYGLKVNVDSIAFLSQAN